MANSGTHITYNYVTIKDVLIEDWNQEVVYDSPQVDPLFVRVQITATGYVHLGPNWERGTRLKAPIATSFQDYQEKLLCPRKLFTMTIGGQIVYQVGAPAGDHCTRGDVTARKNMDVNHGPRPRLKVLEVHADQAMKVQFSIELAIPYCCAQAGGQNNSLIGLRFWISDDIDAQDWTTTRTYTGTLRVRHMNDNVFAAFVKNFVSPPVQAGFKRESVRLAQSANGLELGFTIVDREYWALPPAPATWWDGSYSVSMPNVGGFMAESELKLSVMGPKTVAKPVLYTLCTRIAEAKMHLIDRIKKGQALILYAAFNESLTKNKVEFTARIRHIKDKDQANYSLYNMVGKDLGKRLDETKPPMPGYNSQFSWNPGATATVSGLFLSCLGRACKPPKMPQSKARKPPAKYEEERKGPDYEVELEEDGQIENYTSEYDREHLKNPYMRYDCTSDLNIDRGYRRFAMGQGSLNSGADTTTEIRVHRGQATRQVRIEAQRLNKFPELPAQQSFVAPGGIVHTLIDYNPQPSPPQLSADGVKTMHSTDAVITYELSRPPKPNENIPVGRLPYHGKANDPNFREIKNSLLIPAGGARSIV